MTRRLRVVVVAESPTDEAVAVEVVAATAGALVDVVAAARTVAPGWPAVLHRLPGAVRRAHFDPTVDAVVALADADRSPVHRPTVSAPEVCDPNCRLCLLRQAAQSELGRCPPTPARTAPLRIAVGTPVPSVEAWLLCGVHPGVAEAGWSTALREGRAQGTVGRLKVAAFGARGLATSVMEPRARALIREALLRPSALRTAFPGGYGPLEDAILAW